VAALPDAVVTYLLGGSAADGTSITRSTSGRAG
jgi:hypothetical protein